MVSPIRTNPADVLLAVKARLIYWLDTRLVDLEEDALLPGGAVEISVARPDLVPHFQADRELLVCPLEENPDEPAFEGGGRTDVRATRVFQVVVRTRQDIDRTGSDLERLTRTSVGHLRLEHDARDALVGVVLADGNPASSDEDDWLTTHPLAWRGTTAPLPDPDASWVSSRLTFTAGYWVDVDQSVDVFPPE